jgi:branched-chain amino acid transport system permease protein
VWSSACQACDQGLLLIVSTLAAQFFVTWALTKFGWFSNNNASGVDHRAAAVVLGQDLSSPRGGTS